LRSRRSLALAVVVLVAVAILIWWGGDALWHLVLKMHGRG
jgi:hypothetical protein